MLSLALCMLMVFGMFVVSGAAETEVHAAGGKTLAELQAMFPDGAYWNHEDNWGGNDPYKVTNQPCKHHDKCDFSAPNKCNCNYYGDSRGAGIQCMGFAHMLADLSYGTNDSFGWSKTYSTDTLKAGDIVRYSPSNYGHSIFVTAVQGDTVTYVDCNGVSTKDGTYMPCRILWNQVTTKQKINQSLKHVFSAPYALNTETRTPVDVGTNFYAMIINPSTRINNVAKPITNDQGNAAIWEETRLYNQIWWFNRMEDGSYTITNKDGVSDTEQRGVLDAENSGTTPGTNVKVWGNQGSNNDNQRWYLYEYSDGYIIKAKYCNLVMEVAGGGTANGTNIQLNTENGGNAQKFEIYKLTPRPTQVSVSAGSDCSATKLFWEQAHEATQYTVKIWNGAYTEGEPYKVLWNVTDLSCEVDLPAGYYEAYVDSANKWHYTRSSNIVQFTVTEGGHAFGDWERITEPTCTSMGEEKRTCTSCGKTENRPIEMAAHTWSDTYTVQQAPTCTVAGSEARLCTVCSAADPDSYREIPAAGHSFGDWTMTPDSTCTDGGSESRVCTACGFTETRNVDPTSHLWQSAYTVDKEPTCTEDGSESIHCENCSTTKDSRTIPATGHSFGEWVTILAATCTENGEEERTCAACGYMENNVVTAPGHSWGTEYTTDIPATCTEDGSESIHCANCDVTKDARLIAAVGHQWQSDFTVDTEPTETEEGSKSIHCENCDAVKDVMTIPPTGTSEPTGDPKPTEKPDENLQYMLKIEGEDKIQITEGLKAAGIGSVEQVREKLLASVSQNEGYSAERASLFEVILRVSKDNGYTWGYVSAANFPESGEARVTLPYPQGAPKDTPKENYRVYHMFTEDINGHKAGEIEECPVEKINEGLVVTLHGLSPVMIAWTPVDETAKPTAEPTSAPTAAPSAEPTDAPDTQPEATAEPTAAPSEKPVVDAPKTGDSGVHFLWIAAVLLSGSVITALAFVKRKKQ